ncbi:MAG: UDP-3-O-(3-hydroxymyristoyl)glucosamine N-acyltransferase [Steroidobacteraceae bacterium]
MSRSLGALAVEFGCRLRGDPDIQVSSVATLEGGSSSLGFVASPAYRAQLLATRLAAVVVDERLAEDCPVAALVHANPHATFARIAAVLHPAPPVAPGVHATAVVDPSAQVDASAEIAALVVIGAGAVIGPRCRIAAHCIVGPGVTLGADTTLHERVTVCGAARIGSRCILHPGAVVGSEGFGHAKDDGQWVKVPQVGSVRVGDDVEIGANTAVDRGALVDTVIDDGARLDNLIQVGHNVFIGAHTAIAGCVAIAGSTRIGRRCMIGAGVVILGQLSIGDDIVIGGVGVVTRSLDKPGMYASVFPVEDVRLWRRLVGRFRRLDLLMDRVSKLETTLSIKPAGQNDDN